MAESKVKRENFVHIGGWMLTDLHLKGNELLIYAIIYGFSQDGEQTFSGSLQYLADWTNSTKQGVSKSLKSLVDKGLIDKIEKFVNGVKFCEYRTTKFNGVYNKVSQGMQQSLMGGMQQSLTNNIDTDNTEDITENNNRKKVSKKEPSGYDAIVKGYTENEGLQLALYEFIKMRKMIKKPLTDRALTLICNKLNALANDEYTRQLILEQSISNCWQGVFPLRQENGYNRPNNQNQQNQNNNAPTALDALFG